MGFHGVPPCVIPTQCSHSDDTCVTHSSPFQGMSKGNWRAHVRLWVSLGVAVVSVVLLHVLPWYLVPLGWLALGSAMFGMSAVVNACALGTFTKLPWVNSIVGSECMISHVYPLLLSLALQPSWASP